MLDSIPLLHMRATVQTLPQDLNNNDSYSSSKPYLISLTPLPDAWGLHTKEGEWVPADNNQPDHQQFEHRQEGSNMAEEINKKRAFNVMPRHGNIKIRYRDQIKSI